MIKSSLNLPAASCGESSTHKENFDSDSLAKPRCKQQGIRSLCVFNNLLLLLIPAFFIIFPTVSFAKVFKKNMTVMGTDLEVTVSAGDEAKAEGAFSIVRNEMIRIEDEMSEWKEGTYVSLINSNAGKRAVKVPDDLFKLIAASVQVSEITDGAFDITWAAMRGIWDFAPGHERVPSSEEVRSRLPLVDYRKIELNEKNRTVFLKGEGMAMGLGAIAKGYAVDMAVRAVADSGIKDAIIRAGGDMRVQGLDNEGKPWEIGIRQPREKDKLLARLRLTDISISTSGDYERFFIKDNVLYHHIMDPKTGYPAKSCRSVTILAPDTMTSDVLSTAVFVLGPQKGMELIKKLKGVEGIIVDSDGSVHTSPGIRINRQTFP